MRIVEKEYELSMFRNSNTKSTKNQIVYSKTDKETASRDICGRLHRRQRLHSGLSRTVRPLGAPSVLQRTSSLPSSSSDNSLQRQPSDGFISWCWPLCWSQSGVKDYQGIGGIGNFADSCRLAVDAVFNYPRIGDGASGRIYRLYSYGLGALLPKNLL